MSEIRYVIRVSHIRAFDGKDALEYIKKHWNDHDKMDNYAKENKLELEVFPL